MFGGEGDDDLFSGPGDDGMEGEAGTDEHYGGRDDDFIDAANDEGLGTDAPDLVDCESGFDTAVVRPNDDVRANCEGVTELTTLVAETGTADDEEQQRQKELFLQQRGG